MVNPAHPGIHDNRINCASGKSAAQCLPSAAPSKPERSLVGMLVDHQNNAISRAFRVANVAEDIANKLFGPVPESDSSPSARAVEGFAYLFRQVEEMQVQLNRIEAALERINTL